MHDAQKLLAAKIVLQRLYAIHDDFGLTIHPLEDSEHHELAEILGVDVGDIPTEGRELSKQYGKPDIAYKVRPQESLAVLASRIDAARSIAKHMVDDDLKNFNVDAYMQLLDALDLNKPYTQSQ